MCGILCRVGRQSVDLPTEIRLEQRDGYKSWGTRDRATINEFTSRGIDKFKLNQSDLNKLNNSDKLRELNNSMSKIRNNVKLDKETLQQKLDAIQIEIDSIIGTSDDDSQEIFFRDLIYSITARGPDYISLTEHAILDKNVMFFSSVLSLRQPFTPQPIMTTDFIFQFNGELYNDDSLLVNDTEFFLNVVNKNLGGSLDSIVHEESTSLTEGIAKFDELLNGVSRSDAIFKAIKSLSGEFAFVLYDLKEDMIYFGRDAIGRRSLLYSLIDDELIISSTPLYSSKECLNEIITYNLKTTELTPHPYKQNYSALSYNPVIDQEAGVLNSGSQEPTIKLLRSNELLLKLKQAVKIRQDSIFSLHPLKSSLAVLFSGGLDCTVIASLICENFKTAETIHNIDLLTVGFDNPRTNQSANSSPDRKLAKKSWFELAKKYNNSAINVRLVEINVDYESWLLHQKRVKKLMLPVNTEMDLSIAIAFYFASSTRFSDSAITMTELIDCSISFEDFLKNERSYSTVETNFVSEASVLFSGLGADELFAGYSRHEALFQKLTSESNLEEISSCYHKLSEELIHDINVIHTRNLGRDDRVISCWGKELRYPFLDETVINYSINEIEPNLKFSYKFDKKVTKKQGEITVMIPTRKHILREVAGLLGLHFVKDEIKRAIQFGAKSAKLEIGQSKAKGTDSL